MRRKAFIQLLVAYDLLNGFMLLFMFVMLSALPSVEPAAITMVYAQISIHLLLMVGANLGIALRRAYGPWIVLGHSCVFTLFMIIGLSQSPPAAPKGKESVHFTAGRVIGTVLPILLQGLLAAAAFRAMRIPEEESASPVVTDTSDTHSAVAVLLAQAAMADGVETPEKIGLAAEYLGQLVGPNTQRASLERRIRSALKMSTNDAALTRACAMLATRFEATQIHWLIQAIGAVAGSDELASSFVEDVRAKLEPPAPAAGAKPARAPIRTSNPTPAAVRVPKPRPRA